jgi:hypothetical protein
MATYQGEGDLYEVKGEGENEREEWLRWVGYSITTVPAPASNVWTTTGPVLAIDERVDIVGQLKDVDESGDFRDLMGINRIFRIRFDGGGHWTCMITGSGGEVRPHSDDFVPPPADGG